MKLSSKLEFELQEDARAFINLYAQLNDKAENFLPRHIIDNLRNFSRLCHEEANDPTLQQQEINRQLLELKEAIPGYIDVSLMLFPHEESKAFEYRSKKMAFKDRLTTLINNEAINEEQQIQAKRILNAHDYSVGTPPVTQTNLDFRYKMLLGDQVSELRKFRQVIGIKDDIEESQWNYLLDVLDQMIVQSSHYTTHAETSDFLTRMEQSINFKGLNGFLKTVVSGNTQTAINLFQEELFGPGIVKVISYKNAEQLYAAMQEDRSAVFLIKIKQMRRNELNQHKWFPLLTRMIFVDDSPMAENTNTSLVFCLHNQVLQTLNKVHTKKLGAHANTQLNLRLILEKVSVNNLSQFKTLIEEKISSYEKEIAQFKAEQLGETDNLNKDIVLFKFDEFARQIIKDKYSLQKLRDYLELIINCTQSNQLKKQNLYLTKEFEERTRKYYYSNNANIHVAAIVEGGGRNQIKTYGNYLLQRKLKPVNQEIIDRCRVILSIIPETYERTLKNHFHKNFGINLFLEKYKQYLIKAENEAENKGRFKNFLIDLGIEEKYEALNAKHKQIVQEFISSLANLDKTSISDDVQMIIRDVLFGKQDKVLQPYILFNRYASWEYVDLFPTDKFDINPFDLEIGVDAKGRIDYERLTLRLERMKSTFTLFDETGALWDSFCENLSIVINDPANPSGYSDFNSPHLLQFLKLISTSKITLFLDEAYNDSVKNDSDEDPKWRTISRYVLNNLNNQYARINIVSSLSTTKNLGATGNRVGTLIATPAKKEVIAFAKKTNQATRVNTNSLFMLVNVLENAQFAKTIKNHLEERLPKNASRNKIKQKIEEYIISEIESYQKKVKSRNTQEQVRFSPFEGSPLHIFLLEELVALDKLDVLELPDDFQYRDEPFFTYYQKQLVRNINSFRVNKNFRNEALHRLELAKKVAHDLIKEKYTEHASVVASDGSYLFNMQLSNKFSYQDMEKFTKKLAEQRGIAVIPYHTGFLRFSLGDYLDGTEKGYTNFKIEFKNALEIVLKYWLAFTQAKLLPENSDKGSDEILEQVFYANSDRSFISQVLEDFNLIKKLDKKTNKSLRINDLWTPYHASPAISGVSINNIEDSQNAVIEFSDSIGHCDSLPDFINSKAFTSIYENLLPQVSKKIPYLSQFSKSELFARFGKPALLKYISNKLNYQPNYYVLDHVGDHIIMAEILLEMEQLLFSPAKTKILAIADSGKPGNDIAQLEGTNMILRKNIQELMLHFNLPFENPISHPSLIELTQTVLQKFEWVIGIKSQQLNLKLQVKELVQSIYKEIEKDKISIGQKLMPELEQLMNEKLKAEKIDTQIAFLYLASKDSALKTEVLDTYRIFNDGLKSVGDLELEALIGEFLLKTLPKAFESIWNRVSEIGKQKVDKELIHKEIRLFTLFLINQLNQTKNNERYDSYTHAIIHLSEASFKEQNSAVNQMVQHGFTLHKGFDTTKHPLQDYKKGELAWIIKLMSECGVVGAEKNIQTHTRIATDAKKREYPFHKVDRDEKQAASEGAELSKINDYIKTLHAKPDSKFFIERLKSFINNLDTGEYRCKIFNGGIINELFIYHKAYMKYMADNFRLLDRKETTLEELGSFIPDTVCFYGAPSKVISFPKVGYFDIPGPSGNIKTIVTPLTSKGDYYGNIKKPRLTIMNEKVKEMGGIPVHGSLFAIEEDDGAVFVVQVAGDSGVGKSEMLAAMMLKWMKNNLSNIRSLKMIAGDMFHVFPDKEGNLYGIGTEVGDFSRVTDFDPEYIEYYYSLFQSSADSNVEDLNSRSTIGGLCDVSIPYKIDIMLTASNFAREEAGITRYENPENFILYRDSHGERKEKATSGDNPHFQRTLLRYTDDRAIVDVLDKHGSYLDDMLDWEKDEFNGITYLCSSYKMIDKIDLLDVVSQIFVNKSYTLDDCVYRIDKVDFDIISNRFLATVHTGEDIKTHKLTRAIFNSVFNALASTPGGQPFIAEKEEHELKQHLVERLKTGEGRKIQLGILSTDIGREGKEITGPQMAAEDMRKLIREVRITRPEINTKKNEIKNLIHKKYEAIFSNIKDNAEVYRYNFWLWQMEQMGRAKFVRFDNPKKEVKLSGFNMHTKQKETAEFSPLLLTPNLNIELSVYSETYMQLLDLPHIAEFALEFAQLNGKIYIAHGYAKETIINNMVLQLLLLQGYLLLEDITRGTIINKVNRETIAAAKYAAHSIFDKYNTNNKE